MHSVYIYQHQTSRTFSLMSTDWYYSLYIIYDVLFFNKCEVSKNKEMKVNPSMLHKILLTARLSRQNIP